MGTLALGHRAVRVAILTAALVSCRPATAQLPVPPFPATEPPAPVCEPIEIYYGVKKVAPPPIAAPEPVVVQASAAGNANIVERSQSAESIAEVMHAVSDGVRDVSSAMGGFIRSVGEREKNSAEPRQIVIPSSAMPVAGPSSASSQPQPQVVVIRESAETRPLPEAASGLNFNLATIVAFSLGLLGLAFSLFNLLGGTRKKQHLAAPIFQNTTSPVPIDPNSVRLMGKFNAGPKPESAEKFEIGPTYLDQLQKKKIAETANDAAAVEFILNQNLALLATLNPRDAGSEVYADEEGYALPADAAHTAPAMA